MDRARSSVPPSIAGRADAIWHLSCWMFRCCSLHLYFRSCSVANCTLCQPLDKVNTYKSRYQGRYLHKCQVPTQKAPSSFALQMVVLVQLLSALWLKEHNLSSKLSLRRIFLTEKKARRGWVLEMWEFFISFLMEHSLLCRQFGLDKKACVFSLVFVFYMALINLLNHFFIFYGFWY